MRVDRVRTRIPILAEYMRLGETMESVFHHVGIYCRDIEESIAFYEDVLGCRLLFKSDALEGDKPLKMAWARRGNLVFELLECEDKSTCEAAANCLNHVALRVDDMDGFVAHLGEKGVAVEAGPFDPPLEFDRPLTDGDSDVFAVCGDAGSQLRIMFFHGPGGERFEAVQDNIEAL